MYYMPELQVPQGYPKWIEVSRGPEAYYKGHISAPMSRDIAQPLCFYSAFSISLLFYPTSISRTRGHGLDIHFMPHDFTNFPPITNTSSHELPLPAHSTDLFCHIQKVNLLISADFFYSYALELGSCWVPFSDSGRAGGMDWRVGLLSPSDCWEVAKLFDRLFRRGLKRQHRL